MRLTYRCSSCKRENYLKENAETRPDLQLQIGGNEVRVNCKFCGKIDKKHINRITAKSDKRVLIIGFFVGVIVSIGLIYLFGFIASLAFSIPIMVWRYESDVAHKFNSYAIRR
jgi:hypothetical protein